MAEVNTTHVVGGALLAAIGVIIIVLLLGFVEANVLVWGMVGGIAGAFIGGGSYLAFCGLTGRQPKW